MHEVPLFTITETDWLVSQITIVYIVCHRISQLVTWSSFDSLLEFIMRTDRLFVYLLTITKAEYY